MRVSKRKGSSIWYICWGVSERERENRMLRRMRRSYFSEVIDVRRAEINAHEVHRNNFYLQVLALLSGNKTGICESAARRQGSTVLGKDIAESMAHCR